MPSTSTVAKLGTKFELGQIVGTPRAMRELDKARQAPWEYIISRHGQCDWGEVSRDDWKANDDGLNDGERMMSLYTLPTGVKVWVITEADRSATTILLPEEY